MIDHPRDALTFPLSESQTLDPYVPPTPDPEYPTLHVTLTFATSLDSSLSLAPGTQTALSGLASKSMTHYLRSKHDAILIGVGTAVADNPSLNCRIGGVGGYGGKGLKGQPRPVVLDPRGRWEVNNESKVIKLAKEGRGKAPWVIRMTNAKEENAREKEKVLKAVGGDVFIVPSECSSASESMSRIDWSNIFSLLTAKGIRSVMIEGGGGVINDLLHPQNFGLVDTVIVTIAPVWLGKGGVQVCPDERVEEGVRIPVGRLRDVKWVPLGEDVVLCGRP
ncbi:bacterial bifunctional deaminase-reductase [Melanomma pulvis-pyrius CBS 109.77]|uniref:2,5-diamino-6-ribosylamino-4(3H)-pyrimidinone 5'-phosphate reductase n=1 Tax=Melanomma pulvis-pyrius CBS 109.77 TaxID=1314802 RepID=A0A6A6X8C1_9PLEO|nr:bacterial bifunctional deaminase-reductase [Melanomma pulvis-pyrius CBS 109.77]